MEIRKLLPYLAQGVIVGAAIGFFTLLLFRPDTPRQELPVPVTSTDSDKRKHFSVCSHYIDKYVEH